MTSCSAFCDGRRNISATHPHAEPDVLDALRRLAIAPDAAVQLYFSDYLKYPPIDTLRTPRISLIRRLMRDVLKARARYSNFAQWTISLAAAELPPSPTQDGSATASVDQFLLHQARRVGVSREFVGLFGIPQRLPLIDAVMDHFARDLPDLEDWNLLAVQHVLGSNVPLLRALHQLGMPYDRMHLIGKVYSTSPIAAEAFRQLGVQVHDGLHADTRKLAHRKDYENALRQTCRQVLADLLTSTPNRNLLVLDDGAVAISEVLLTGHPRCQRVAAVEQTRRGQHALRALRRHNDVFPFPVVNVAESSAKLRLEYPLMARSVVKELEARLARHSARLQQHNVLLIGYGALGEAIGDVIVQQDPSAYVHVWDKDPGARNIAKGKGMALVESLEVGLARCDIVIGSTGKRALGTRSVQDVVSMLQSGTRLVSASSSNSEFLGFANGQFVPERGSVAPTFTGGIFESTHADWVEPRSGVSVLNGGYPVNFTGDVDPIPANEIQLTRALMFGGALQGVTSNFDRGIQRLSREVQGVISAARGPSARAG